MWAPAVKVWSPNHWTMREVPALAILYDIVPCPPPQFTIPHRNDHPPHYMFTCSSAYFLSLTLEYNSYEDKDLAWFPVVSPAPRIVPGTSQVPNKYLLSRKCVYHTQPKAP